MSEISVGKEVLSYCGKCKLALAHLIVSMKSEITIHKVTCKTCDATHVYKDPSAVKVKRTRLTKTVTGATKISKKAEAISDLWMEAVNNSKVKSQDYSIKHKFNIGDIIDHSKFGPGVVERAIDGDKIEVIFRHEIKILIHNR